MKSFPADARVLAKVGLQEPVADLLKLLNPDGGEPTPDQVARVSEILGKLCAAVAGAVLLGVGAVQLECVCPGCQAAKKKEQPS